MTQRSTRHQGRKTPVQDLPSPAFDRLASELSQAIAKFLVEGAARTKRTSVDPAKNAFRRPAL